MITIKSVLPQVSAEQTIQDLPFGGQLVKIPIKTKEQAEVAAQNGVKIYVEQHHYPNGNTRDFYFALADFYEIMHIAEH